MSGGGGAGGGGTAVVLGWFWFWSAIFSSCMSFLWLSTLVVRRFTADFRSLFSFCMVRRISRIADRFDMTEASF